VIMAYRIVLHCIPDDVAKESPKSLTLKQLRIIFKEHFLHESRACSAFLQQLFTQDIRMYVCSETFVNIILYIEGKLLMTGSVMVTVLHVLTGMGIGCEEMCVCSR